VRVRVEPIQDHTLPLLLLALLGLLGFLSPWTLASSAPMTLNAFDLAEWTSLHPAQRHTSPPLLAPLLLRAQLVFLTLVLALAASGRPWKVISAVAVILLALAQLPPFEYVYDIANVNYRQQFLLALVSLIGGLVALRARHRRVTWILLFLLPIVGIVTAFTGFTQAIDVYRQLLPIASTGLGPWLLTASYVGISAVCLRALGPRASNAMN